MVRKYVSEAARPNTAASLRKTTAGARVTRILFQISVVDPWGGLLISLQKHVYLLYCMHVVFFPFLREDTNKEQKVKKKKKTQVNLFTLQQRENG